MKASTRIDLLHQRLQAIAALPAEAPELLLHRLQSCLAAEGQNLMDNYPADPSPIMPIRWLLTTPLAEIPVSDFAVEEFRRVISCWQPTANPNEALMQVARAVERLVVYQVGWSEQAEDQPLEVLFDEQRGEVVVCDLVLCHSLNGEAYSAAGPFRPATKSELLAGGLYTYHSAAKLN